MNKYYSLNWLSATAALNNMAKHNHYISISQDGRDHGVSTCLLHGRDHLRTTSRTTSRRYYYYRLSH